MPFLLCSVIFGASDLWFTISTQYNYQGFISLLFFSLFIFGCWCLCSIGRLQPASYGKKNGMWYASPGNQGWGSKSAARNSSVLDADITANQPNVLKPSAGRVIRIVNNLDHNVQVSAMFCFVLLSLHFNIFGGCCRTTLLGLAMIDWKYEWKAIYHTSLMRPHSRSQRRGCTKWNQVIKVMSNKRKNIET